MFISSSSTIMVSINFYVGLRKNKFIYQGSCQLNMDTLSEGGVCGVPLGGFWIVHFCQGWANLFSILFKDILFKILFVSQIFESIRLLNRHIKI